MLSSDRYPPLQGVTLLTGNARLSRQIRHEFDLGKKGQGEKVWDSPDILPRDTWLRRCWDDCVYRAPVDAPALLAASQELVLWERAIEESGASENLLDAPTTAATAATAWDLMCSWELPRIASVFVGLADTEAFFGWMNAVEAKLRDNHWLTSSQIPRALTERIQAGALRITEKLYYAGFDEIAPSDQRLFDAIRESGGIISELPTLVSSSESQHFRVACENTSDEILHAAAWARKQLQVRQGGRFGIVVRGLGPLRAMVERIFDEVLHPGLDLAGPNAPRAFHISAGAPLKDLPLVAAALLVLGLRRGISLADAGTLLRSPFLRLDPAVRASVDAALRREGSASVSVDAPVVRRHFDPLARAFQESPDVRRPSQWSATFSQLLKRAGWPGDRILSHAEHQALERWNELLSEFAQLDLVIQTMKYDGALSRLRRLAGERPFAPRDEGAPIQIMDVLEAAGSPFDALWIAGLHDRAWPQPPQPNPFLPLMAQRLAGAPHSSVERELRYARRLTERLLRSAPEVVCSYPAHWREERLRISPLIAHLPNLDDVSFSTETIAEVLCSTAVPLEERELEQAPMLPLGTEQSGGMNVLSDQAACPFRAFAVHRLGAQGLDVPVVGLSPIERGSIAHVALELLWKELKTQQALKDLLEEQRSALIRRSVRGAMDRALKGHASAVLQRLQVLEEDRLEKLLQQWLRIEADRPPFDIADTETTTNAELGGLKLHIKADRVDRYADGRHAILDYKTSKNLSLSGWESERPDAPQLPLYAAMSERPISSVLFAKLVAGEPALVGISESGEQAGRQPKGPPLAERIQGWRAVMEALATNFRQGHAAVDPKKRKQTCQYCDLTPLCRIGELSRGLVEREEESDE